ncbi:MAG: chemotaxis protein CheA [Cyclobacteriaceae bacterium]
MDEFVQEFRAEASSIINQIQESLLLLEQDSKSKELVEEIFRGIHTLKGSSRMFGFEKIELITHELENTYELVRSGEMVITSNIIQLSFEVVDMAAHILKGDYDKKSFQDLTKKLGSDEVFVQDNPIDSGGIFQVIYYPKANVYERGINPMAAIDELKEMGDCKIFPLKEEIPVEEQEASKKFESVFEILIEINKDVQELKDVFIFMEDEEFEIHKIDDDNTDVFIKRANKHALPKLTKKQIADRHEWFNAQFKGVASEGVIEKKDKNKVLDKKPNTTTGSPLNYLNVKLDRLDEMMKLVSELVTIKAEITYRSHVIKDAGLADIVERLDKVTARFRDNAFSMRLVPLQILSLKFQRMVRDLGDNMDKKVTLLTEGLDTEIDKTIINEIEAPLMHIIRNAIDHGIETTSERKQLGKEEAGLLKIVAFYAGANVFIQIQDDGRGLNLQKIKEKAINRGIIGKNQKLTDGEIINLIFEPGFSTHERATEYSGRGVGMDVVKQKLKELRGSIEITTEEGLGTAFTLRLPLSLSILNVLHVKVGDINYLLTHNEIERCYSERLDKEFIQKRGYNMKYNGELIPHLALNKIFGEKSKVDEEKIIIIINKNDQNISLEVDEIIGEEQLVIKPVDEALKRLDYLSGVSVLGNGELAFLLDSIKLKESFAKEINEEKNFGR